MHLKLSQPLFLSLFLLAFSGTLSAQQTVKEWFSHPALSAAAMVSGKYTPQDGSFKPSTIAMLRAGFGAEKDPFKVTVIFDLPSTRFLTCEALWQPLPQIGVRVGLQKMLFLNETTYAPYLLGMIGYSQAASFLGGYSADIAGISSRSRDVGIVLQGSFFPTDEGFSRLNYAVGVFNGNGYSFIDNNKAKDVHGRLIFQPNRRLRFSMGVMSGYYTPEEHRPNGHHHTAEDLACRYRLTAGVWYEGPKWFLRGENIYGLTDGLRSDGAMLMAGWTFRPRLQLAARVDHFQHDLSNRYSGSTKADICFTHNLTSDGTIYYAIQYGHTFFTDPNVKGYDSITFCLNIALMRWF